MAGRRPPLAPAELHRACSDFRRTSRRALLSRGAARVLPLPEALLEAGSAGFAAERRTRRELLAGGVGAFVALAAASRLTPWELVERARAAETGEPILVTLFLPGGNDGLGTVVPLAGPDREAYERGRPRIAVAAEAALPIPGHPDLGWHPAAPGLRDLYDAGLLGVYLAADYPNPDFSHFHSTKYWRSGTLDMAADTGWLGRYLDEAGSLDNPLQGVAVEWSTDDVLASRRAPTCALFSPGDFDFWSPGVWDSSRMLEALRELGGDPSVSARRRAVEIARQSVQVRDALGPLRAEDEAGGAPAPPRPYPDSDTGAALRNLARLLGAGLGVRVATVQSAGMFDTHEGQPEQLRWNLTDLGAALVAFQADLERRGLAQRVVTLVWSEFGRRVEDNDSFGTDHGAGGLLLAVGPRVAGGLAVPAWELGHLGATDGNVPVAIDFRDVYAGVLEQHLGIEAARILPGYAGEPLPVIA
ncbi:MAG: DUF1501 domain-containing protein [Thermoleophilia bacterium]|nr:DUF1501 domain-containing protein [Thermoleophilia bacterium]